MKRTLIKFFFQNIFVFLNLVYILATSTNNIIFVFQYHCYKCGDVFCTRCMALKSPLPGHDSNKPVSVCRSCYKELQRSTSIDTP